MSDAKACLNHAIGLAISNVFNLLAKLNMQAHMNVLKQLNNLHHSKMVLAFIILCSKVDLNKVTKPELQNLSCRSTCVKMKSRGASTAIDAHCVVAAVSCNDMATIFSSETAMTEQAVWMTTVAHALWLAELDCAAR